ncbi:28394_t:CDS:2 [Gigaspora margarita]|uniref:28394_t:CDS:1 n=1 Tax=Gigaspora margarita TaxID=4874 RepID=A0ABN7UQP7_GIGMA|nr:28394_t:CDS:2 [Gigaspora margarita]
MNLQSKKADITYAQLFQAVPNIRKETLKILKLRRTAYTQTAEFCLNKNEETYTMLIYCEAQVKEKPIILILDSRLLGCMELNKKKADEESSDESTEDKGESKTEISKEEKEVYKEEKGLINQTYLYCNSIP